MINFALLIMGSGISSKSSRKSNCNNPAQVKLKYNYSYTLNKLFITIKIYEYDSKL